ncbi:MAG: DUF6773 family protein [Candidatus Pristimantibacillus sp.]
MKWWPFKNKIVDERIVNTRNKIYKETYVIVSLLCSVSVIVKYIYYGQNINMIATELVILLASSLYFGIRSVMLGLYSDEVEVHDRKSKIPFSTKNMIWGLALGIVIALFFGIRSSIVYADNDMQSVKYFIVVFFVSMIIYIPFLLIVLTSTHYFANQISKKAADDDLVE